MSSSPQIHTEVQNYNKFKLRFSRKYTYPPIKVVWFNPSRVPPLPTPLEFKFNFKIFGIGNDPQVNLVSVTFNVICFAARWDDCIQVVRLHHLCHPMSMIAEQASRNNLKGFFMVRVSIDSTVELAVFHLFL